MIDIDIDVRKLTADLDDFARNQVPFAMARAINGVRLDFQAEERRHMHRTFRIRRRSFIERQGVKIKKFARKRDLESIVGVDDKADFLLRHEHGTPKRPRDGKHITIPVNVTRRKSNDIISRRDRPKRMLDERKKVFIARQDTARTAHLPPGIYERRGGKRKPKLRLLYSLRLQTRITPVLRYRATAREVARERFPRHWALELADALRTARR